MRRTVIVITTTANTREIGRIAVGDGPPVDVDAPQAERAIDDATTPLRHVTRRRTRSYLIEEESDTEIFIIATTAIIAAAENIMPTNLGEVTRSEVIVVTARKTVGAIIVETMIVAPIITMISAATTTHPIAMTGEEEGTIDEGTVMTGIASGGKGKLRWKVLNTNEAVHNQCIFFSFRLFDKCFFFFFSFFHFRCC